MSPRAISTLARILSIFLLIASILIPISMAAFLIFGNSLELSLLGQSRDQPAGRRFFTDGACCVGTVCHRLFNPRCSWVSLASDKLSMKPRPRDGSLKSQFRASGALLGRIWH